MRITKKECVAHYETIEETFHVRIQIKKGKILTFKVDVEDGSPQYWIGKDVRDKNAYDKLSQQQKNQIIELIEEMSFD